MKNLIFLVAVIITMLAPVGGCKVFRKVSKQKVHTTVDSTNKVNVAKLTSNVDSSEKATVISKKDNAAVKSVTITESTGEAKTEAFTITSSFRLDPNAGGDTLRFVSMEDDRMKVEIFADKKTGQGTAKISNKGQTVKMPFRQVNITNASVNKDFDSSAFEKRAIINHSQIDSSVLTDVKRETTTKNVDREVKKDFGLFKWVGLIVLIIAALRLAIWLLRKQWPWMGWLNRILGGK